VIVALTTTNKVLLGGMGAIFIVFALASAFLIPRFRPDFPGRRVGLFSLACVALFVAMMLSVEFFAVEDEEAHGGTATEVSSGTTATGGGQTQPSGGETHELDVAASEFEFDLSGEPEGAGKYAFHLTNEGQTGHDLVVEGPGVKDEKTRVIDPGQSAELDVDLKAGQYTLYCSVPGHRDAGMETTIEVK
jgi:uncharacterized cupredoxin-like copper-binding protein